MMNYVSNSGEKTKYPGARREAQVQGKSEKMREIRKGSRIKAIFLSQIFY
jgi:hypothetical protein